MDTACAAEAEQPLFSGPLPSFDPTALGCVVERLDIWAWGGQLNSRSISFSKKEGDFAFFGFGVFSHPLRK